MTFVEEEILYKESVIPLKDKNTSYRSKQFKKYIYNEEFDPGSG